MSAPVIEHALAEAHRLPWVGLHFITVVEPSKGRFTTKEPSDEDLQSADASLRQMVGEILPTFSSDEPDSKRSLRFHTRTGKADEQIIELAMEARADLLVIGSHSKGKKTAHRKVLGGISAAVVNQAPCTVEVVRIADYEGTDEDYAACPACVAVRASSHGNQWFCPEHSDGRVPRLSGRVGLSSPVSGWGIF